MNMNIFMRKNRHGNGRGKYRDFWESVNTESVMYVNHPYKMFRILMAVSESDFRTVAEISFMCDEIYERTRRMLNNFEKLGLVEKNQYSMYKRKIGVDLNG